jgi:hypothetical protein
MSGLLIPFTAVATSFAAGYGSRAESFRVDDEPFISFINRTCRHHLEASIRD